MPETTSPANMQPIRVAVRELTGFLARAGSLDSRAGVNRLVEGTRMHKILQSRGGAGYVPEVSLTQTLEVEGLRFELSGRADGVIDEEDGYTIDEIKTTTLPLKYIVEDDYPAYWTQAECYAWMFAVQHNLSEIRVRMTFCNIETEDVRYFYHAYRTLNLSEMVYALLAEYKKWAVLRRTLDFELHESASKLKFPFRDFREGQSELVLAVHRAVRRKERLVAQAPTGIGKTMSVLYPSIRALGEGKGRRIFYLTAKTITRTAAMNAVGQLRRRGLCVKSIVLTAKEKICFCREAAESCDSLLCEYSDDHYSRVNQAIWELVSGYDNITRELIEQYARQYKVCPYELSLDVSLWCGVIICDYNYLFDPRVYLRRFFDDSCEPSDNIVLVDEAHNLPDRAREMYSAELRMTPYLKLLRQIPEEDFILYKPLRGFVRQFLKLKRRCGELQTDADGIQLGYTLSKEPFDEFGAACELFMSCAFDWMRANGSTPLSSDMADAAFDALRYVKTLGFADKRFVNWAEVRGDEISVRLLCLDPSKLLSERMAKARAAVLFSATLTPLDYFADILGAKADEKIPCEVMELPSPFPRENLFIAAMDKISTRYADRDACIEATAEILEVTVNARPGNYIAYFPSYKLMRETARAFRALDPMTRCIAQKPSMTESEREAFIKLFDKQPSDGSMLAFAVLGGIFSEGIDLVGEKLIGSIIVGVGMAQLNSETNIVADYFAETRESGFEYAYVYPGMNKVLQAAGRVIRTPDDRGVVLLIDDRFSTPAYTRLYPKHWRHMKLIGDAGSLGVALDEFWGEE